MTPHDVAAAARRRVDAQACVDGFVVAQQLGLDATAWRYVCLLLVHGALTPGQLAELTGMSTGSVTGVLDRLQRAELIDRSCDGSDRRVRCVALTAAAAARLVDDEEERHVWLEEVGDVRRAGR